MEGRCMVELWWSGFSQHLGALTVVFGRCRKFTSALISLVSCERRIGLGDALNDAQTLGFVKVHTSTTVWPLSNCLL